MSDSLRIKILKPVTHPCTGNPFTKSIQGTPKPFCCPVRSSNILATDTKSQLIGKDSDSGKDWGPEEKGAAEDEVVR